MITKLFSILLFIVLGWYLSYEFFYSPKAQIRILWKEIFKIYGKIPESYNKLKKENPDYNITIESVGESVKTIYADSIRKKKELILALLKYHFDQEEDADYIKENMPGEKW